VIVDLLEKPHGYPWQYLTTRPHNTITIGKPDVPGSTLGDKRGSVNKERVVIAIKLRVSAMPQRAKKPDVLNFRQLAPVDHRLYSHRSRRPVGSRSGSDKNTGLCLSAQMAELKIRIEYRHPNDKRACIVGYGMPYKLAYVIAVQIRIEDDSAIMDKPV